MRKLMQPIERFLFGATAEERVAMQMALIDRRVEQMVERAFERLNDPDEEPDEDWLADNEEFNSDPEGE